MIACSRKKHSELMLPRTDGRESERARSSPRPSSSPEGMIRPLEIGGYEMISSRASIRSPRAMQSRSRECAGIAATIARVWNTMKNTMIWYKNKMLQKNHYYNYNSIGIASVNSFCLTISTSYSSYTYFRAKFSVNSVVNVTSAKSNY